MLAKHSHRFGDKWDEHLQQVLFAYHTKPHESTGESPYYLLYGRDAYLPLDAALSKHHNHIKSIIRQLQEFPKPGSWHRVRLRKLKNTRKSSMISKPDETFTVGDSHDLHAP